MLRFVLSFCFIVQVLSSASIFSSLAGLIQPSIMVYVKDLHQSIRSLVGLSTKSNKFKSYHSERMLEYSPSGWLQVLSYPGVTDCSSVSQQTTITALGVCIADGPHSSHILFASGTDDGSSIQQESFSDIACTKYSSLTTISGLPISPMCTVDGPNSVLTTYYPGETPPPFPYSGSMFSLSADTGCTAIIKQTVVNSEYCFSNGASSVEVVCDSANPYVTHVYRDQTCSADHAVSVHQTPSGCAPYSAFVQSNQPQYTYGSALRSCYNTTGVTTRALRGI